MRFWLSVTILALGVAAFAIMVPIATRDTAHAEPPDLVLDMQTGNGEPCSSVEQSVDVETGEAFTIAVCMRGLPEQPAAIDYEIVYDDTKLSVTERANEGTGLDDNPDANAGSTTFGSMDLGDDWDCSGATLKYPQGDANPETGPAGGRILSGGCLSVAGPYRLTGTGVLGVVEMTALVPGAIDLELVRVSITGESGLEAGTCEPPVAFEIDCIGGTINATGPEITPAADQTPDPGATESGSDGTPSGNGSSGGEAPPGTREGSGGDEGLDGGESGDGSDDGSHDEDGSGAQATATAAVASGRPVLAIDADITNGSGPCDEIDTVVEVERGAEFDVAVCLTFPDEPPAAFAFKVLYNERIVNAPNTGSCDGNLRAGEVSEPVAALDCNPDINAGESTFGPGLGEGFECSLGGEGEPWANGPERQGDAYSGLCLSIEGPYTLESPGVLVVLSIQAVADGRSDITLVGGDITGESGRELGSCNPAISVEIPCLGATVTVGRDEGTSTWWYVGGAVVGVAALAAAGAGAYLWKRRAA